MSAIYLQSRLNSDVKARLSATFTAANFLIIANNAANDVVSDVDMKSMIRRSALSPNLFDDVYQYTCPGDLKEDKLIDIRPQLNRGRLDYWELVSPTEFDRYKNEGRDDRWGDQLNVSETEWLGKNLVAIDTRDFVRKLLISKPIDDDELGVDPLDSVGDWTGFGDGGTLTADSDNYVKGNASINWDINADAGTTAGIVNDSLDDFDVSEYKGTGSAFVWAYITSATNLTNFILRVGSSSSAFYYITVTTNSEGNAFEAGWNLIRFDFVNKATTGTPDDDACDYVAIYMTKDAAKVSETDYRFDNLVFKRGDHYNVHYYSKYPWQTSAGSYIENATTTTDLLNADTTEYRLFFLKTCQLMCEHLDNGMEDKYEQRYEKALSKYIFENPSQALLLVEQYYDL